MAKHIWVKNELITAEKLNNLEDRIENESAYNIAVEGGYKGTLSEFTSYLGNAANFANAAAEASSAANAAAELAYDYVSEIMSAESVPIATAANQLNTDQGTVDNEPYNFRVSGGEAHNSVNNLVTNEIVGGTVVWNQQIPNNYSITGNRSVPISSGTTVVTSHVYLFSALRDINTERFVATLYTKINNAAQSIFSIDAPIDGDFRTFTIKRAGYSGVSDGTQDNGTLWIYVGSTVSATVSTEYMLIDLTQMFGSTIADYIYSLETATAGAGVAWFRKLFPKPYYTYDAGSLQSVQVSAYRTVGFNMFNGTFEAQKRWSVDGVWSTGNSKQAATETKMQCVPNTEYCISLPNITATTAVYMVSFNAAGEFIGISTYKNATTDYKYVTFTPESGTNYIAFNLYKNSAAFDSFELEDICVSLAWDGSRNGEYEPYVSHTYPLDNNLVLRGVPKLDADNNYRLYYDGDKYTSDESVIKKYDIVDLGTLNWTYESTYGRMNTADIRNIIKPASANNTVVEGLLCPLYTTRAATNTGSSPIDKTIAVNNNGYILILDSTYTDADAFTSAMNEVYIMYELATPTTESADLYINPQIIDKWGTEEYVDAGNRDVAIPVGHNSLYQIDLKNKLETSPYLPEEDGNYILSYTSGESNYISLPLSTTDDLNYILGVS